MKTSVSVATPSVPLPQMVFQGELEGSLKTVSELGYDGVELFVHSPEEVKLKELLALLRKYNLETALFSAFVSLSKQDVAMGHPDASVRKRFIELAPTHLELAAALNAKVPIGFSRGYFKPGVSQADLDGWFCDCLQEYHRLAVGLGVVLVIEPINRYEINYIHTVSEAMTIMERVDLPNVKLLLDSFHMNIEESSIPLAIVKAKGHIGHVHFVDSNRLSPGFGHTNMPEIYMLLKEAGYDGYLGIETLPKPSPLEAAQAGIEYIHILKRLHF